MSGVFLLLPPAMPGLLQDRTRIRLTVFRFCPSMFLFDAMCIPLFRKLSHFRLAGTAQRMLYDLHQRCSCLLLAMCDKGTAENIWTARLLHRECMQRVSGVGVAEPDQVVMFTNRRRRRAVWDTLPYLVRIFCSWLQCRFGNIFGTSLVQLWNKSGAVAVQVKERCRCGTACGIDI